MSVPIETALRDTRDTQFARQVRVIERVRVDKSLAWHELDVGAAKGVARARGKIAEGHPMPAAHFCIEFVDRADEAVGRKPTRYRIALDEGAIHLLRFGSD